MRGEGEGAVWEYDPRAETLRSLFVAGTAQVADNIDNITVSARGGILLCEDGDVLVDQYGPGTRLLGLTRDGDSFAFAKNNALLTEAMIGSAGKQVLPKDYRTEEFCGACFDPARRRSSSICSCPASRSRSGDPGSVATSRQPRHLLCHPLLFSA